MVIPSGRRPQRYWPGRYENLYVDISSTFFGGDPEEAVDMVRAYGAERVLFGTDFPMWCPKDEVRKFLALPPHWRRSGASSPGITAQSCCIWAA